MNLVEAALALALFAQGPAPAPGTPTIESINVEYERELQAVERRRLDSLGKLAMSQTRDQAAVTLDAYFRLAIAKNLYADAEPIARKVVLLGDANPSVVWLAHLVQIVGEADRGAFDDSLKSLGAALRLKGGDGKGPVGGGAGLSVGTRASIIEAYYQRLLRGDQVDVARKAMALIRDGVDVPALRDLAARRLKQLDLVGKPAPPINGVDLAGKPFTLAEAKGEVVLVVFWATWCVPNAQEVPWLEHLSRTYRAKGFRVVGINLDAPSSGGAELASALPQVRRFLLDYNIDWPTLLNGPADQDHASAFGVTEIPAGVLIGRDGKVTHLDLVGRTLEKAIVAELAKKP